jgi:outer membrane protein
MKKLIVLAFLATTVSMTAGTAMADSIKGEVGVTGRIGFLNPADNNLYISNNLYFSHNRTDIGLVAGVGLIYGIDDHIAAELEITRTSFGSDTGDFGVTNVSFGGQYRFALQQRQLVPYIGVGLDILMSNYDRYDGFRSDVDTTVGGHVSGGVDYFLQRNLALTAEAKLVVAPDARITDRQSGNFRGDFDPSSFSTTVGIRLFFN